jgi:hypothetical protein
MEENKEKRKSIRQSAVKVTGQGLNLPWSVCETDDNWPTFSVAIDVYGLHMA